MTSRPKPTRAARTPAPRATAEYSATPAVPLNEADLKGLIGYQLAQASILTMGVFQDLVGTPHDLKTVEYTMLALIQANPGVSAVQLRKALGLSAAYVTAGLDKLHERGFILREVNQSDRRAQHLRITKAAERLVSELTRTLLAGERQRFATLSTAEQAMLAELLHKLAGARASGSA